MRTSGTTKVTNVCRLFPHSDKGILFYCQRVGTGNKITEFLQICLTEAILLFFLFDWLRGRVAMWFPRDWLWLCPTFSTGLRTSSESLDDFPITRALQASAGWWLISVTYFSDSSTQKHYDSLETVQAWKCHLWTLPNSSWIVQEQPIPICKKIKQETAQLPFISTKITPSTTEVWLVGRTTFIEGFFRKCDKCEIGSTAQRSATWNG